MSRAKQLTPKVVRLVIARSGGDDENGTCERCGSLGHQTHHRRPRGKGGSRDEGTNLAGNLLRLCSPCHDEVESHRGDSLRRGWLVKHGAGPACDPLQVPVDVFKHGQVVTVLLDNDGGWVEADEDTVRRFRGCDRKDTYTSLLAAENAVLVHSWAGRPMRAYPCTYCHSWHLTTKGAA